MTLEEQLISLMKEHNLHAVSVGASILEGGRVFYSAGAHGKDANGVSKCALGPHNLATIKETLAAAIGAVNEMRAVGVVPIGELSAMGDEA